MTGEIQAVVIWSRISDCKSWEIGASDLVFLFYFALDELVSLVGGYCRGTTGEIEDLGEMRLFGGLLRLTSSWGIHGEVWMEMAQISLADLSRISRETARGIWHTSPADTQALQELNPSLAAATTFHFSWSWQGARGSSSRRRGALLSPSPCPALPGEADSPGSGFWVHHVWAASPPLRV